MSARRVRMTGQQRREQLLDVGRQLFAERGYEATSIEEVATRAGVTKPVVYEHFSGKEGLYAVVVDREVRRLLDRIVGSLEADHPRTKLEQVAQAFLAYVEDEPDGFRVLIRDVPAVSAAGTFASLIGDIATEVEYVFAEEFANRGFDPSLAGLYSHALVGMVALVGQWWLETGAPPRDAVAARLVGLAWDGLSGMEAEARLGTAGDQPPPSSRAR